MRAVPSSIITYFDLFNLRSPIASSTDNIIVRALAETERIAQERFETRYRTEKRALYLLQLHMAIEA